MKSSDQSLKFFQSDEPDAFMDSALYKSIFEKGVAQGVAQSQARALADTIVRVLTARLGTADPALRARVRGVTDVDTLDSWYGEALLAVDAAAAQRLADKILAAP